MDSLEKATIAGGCFWCTEAIFQKLKGVVKVTSGYSGGHKENPTYREVCNGQTGHAEGIQIEFDPSKIKYDTLLTIFFKLHDPTTPNQQGNDIGPQYRSAIFYHDDEQKKIAETVKKKLTDDKYFMQPIVTEITKFTNFYPAEDYHQNYFENNKDQPYCRVIIDPKIRKLLSEFSSLTK
jgi:peptide-methionine (S)-S-oxide reductase